MPSSQDQILSEWLMETGNTLSWQLCSTVHKEAVINLSRISGREALLDKTHMFYDV